MRYILLSTLFITVFMASLSAKGSIDSVKHYPLPDSIKAMQMVTTVTIQKNVNAKQVTAGLGQDEVSIVLQADKKHQSIAFSFPGQATIVARGISVSTSSKGKLVWSYNWAYDSAYTLAIATAVDSAGQFSLYSGYVWLPEQGKWKLIGTCKISGSWKGITHPSTLYSLAPSNAASKDWIRFKELWVQRANGSWKELSENGMKPPVVNVVNHLDSLAQHAQDVAAIEAGLASGKTDAILKAGGLYFRILEEGSGRKVLITDTTVVHYKGYLFSDGTVFDQTRDTPASFPLARLIKGWQVGLPLCRVGGKIKLVIPSGMAYSIRTRAPKIPPNSILVFEITVVEVRPEVN